MTFHEQLEVQTLGRVKQALMCAVLLFSILLTYPHAIASDNPPPGAPRDLVLVNLGQEYVYFEWKHPDDEDIICYYIYKNDEFLESTISLARSFTVRGLEPGTTYTFKVSAWDGYSEGPFSNIITVTTESKGSKHGNAVGEITYPLDGQRINSLDRITGTAWDNDGTVIRTALLITGGGLYLKPDMSGFEPAEDPENYYIPAINTGTNYSEWELYIPDFTVFTDGEYLVQVCPFDGMYCAADQVRFIVDITPPAPPGELKAQDITETSVKLAWESPTDPDTVGYLVYMDGNFYDATESTWICVDALTPGTSYSFSVAAHDGLNTGEACGPLQVTTLPESGDSPGDPPNGPPEDPPEEPPSSDSQGLPKAGVSRRARSGQELPGYTLGRYIHPGTGLTAVEGTIMVGQHPDLVKPSPDGNIIVDTTKYFPGKQISRETLILQKTLISEAMGEGRDIILNGGLGSLCIETSRCAGNAAGSDFRVSIQRGESHPALSDFISSRPAFRPIYEAVSVELAGCFDKIPVFFRIPLPEGLPGTSGIDFTAAAGKDGQEETGTGRAAAGSRELSEGSGTGRVSAGSRELQEGTGTGNAAAAGDKEQPEGCRVGYIACGPEGSIICLYEGVRFTASGIMFPVLRPGTYQPVVYNEIYSGFKGHWAGEYLDRVLAMGIYAPEDRSVDPGIPVTRRMLASMLGLVTGRNCPAAEKDDQPINRGTLAGMAAGALNVRGDLDTALRMGLLIGYGDGGIYPDRPATLAEAATVMCRLIQCMGVNGNIVNANQMPGR